MGNILHGLDEKTKQEVFIKYMMRYQRTEYSLLSKILSIMNEDKILSAC